MEATISGSGFRVVNIRCRNIKYTQNGPIILGTTHVILGVLGLFGCDLV